MYCVQCTFKRSPWGRLIDTESTLWQMWSETKTDSNLCTANRFKVVPVGPAEATDFRRMCHKCWPNFKQPGAQDVSVVFGRSLRTRLHSPKLWALPVYMSIGLVWDDLSLSYTSPTGSQDTLPPPSMPSSLVVRRWVSSRSSSFLVPSIIRSLMSTLVSSSQIEM